MIYGVVSNYHLSPHYVLHEMSYANVLMYLAVLPSYQDRETEERDSTIDADDPRNMDKIKKLLYE